MKNVGVICEYNPFHNGHAKQLAAMRSAGTAVCLMSGNFVQRGEPAVIDKWTRARAAVACGADLVLELPITYALRSAEGFADGGVEIFSRLGCVDALCFGSEDGDIIKIMSTAKCLLQPGFSNILREELSRGLSFPAARQNALARYRANLLKGFPNSPYGEEEPLSDRNRYERTAAGKNDIMSTFCVKAVGKESEQNVDKAGFRRGERLSETGIRRGEENSQEEACLSKSVRSAEFTESRENFPETENLWGTGNPIETKMLYGQKTSPCSGIRESACATASTWENEARTDGMATEEFWGYFEQAVSPLLADASLLKRPNSILAVEYCKAILKHGCRLKPMILRREGDYHTGSSTENPSASFLREQLDWAGYIPENALKVFEQAPRHQVASGERAWLARLRSMSEAEFAALPYGSEGLWRRVMRACRTEAGLEDILEASKSKRYTRTRLMRLLLCALIGITAEMLERPAPYVRVLAMNERGQAVLRQVKQRGEIPLIHAGQTPPDAAYAELERRAADLYGLFRADAVSAPDSERRARVYRCTVINR